MKPLLLVVENDASTRRLLEIFLRREAFDVDPVATGSDALLLLDRIDYSAVVLDLLIPGRSGREILDDLAVHRPELLRRIVAISSANDAYLRDLRGRHPAVAVLRKPFDLDALIAAVRDRAATHPRPRASQPHDLFLRRSVAAGAKAGAVAQRGDAVLDLVCEFGYPEGVTAALYPLALSAQYPICLAVRHERAVWISTIKLATTEYPLLAPIWRREGSGAVAAVPIAVGGSVRGVAAWSFPEPRTFDGDEQAQFASIAASAAPLLATTGTTRQASAAKPKG